MRVQVHQQKERAELEERMRVRYLILLLLRGKEIADLASNAYKIFTLHAETYKQTKISSVSKHTRENWRCKVVGGRARM
jgi:hypothetical protein